MKLDLEPLVLEIIGNLKPNQIEKTVNIRHIGTQYDLYNIQISKGGANYDLKIIIWLGNVISEIRVINYRNSVFDDDFKIIISPEFKEFLKLKLL